jgi:hypothetical protein
MGMGFVSVMLDSVAAVVLAGNSVFALYPLH